MDTSDEQMVALQIRRADKKSLARVSSAAQKGEIYSIFAHSRH